MQKNTENKPRQAKSKKYMMVRYGRMNALGFFEHNENEIPKVHTRVVVKTDRGLELGFIVGHLNSYRGGQFKLREDQVKEYFDNSEIDFCPAQAGKFIRFATNADISEERHLEKIAKEEIDFCKKIIKEMNLPMKIVDAEHVFGGERIVFYFMSDGRVDFRELVKRIAQEYQTRIEMRQIGSRDEAKLLGDLESCGQQCCCQRFLKLLKPVNMRMAKMQKATLDPAKISGFCGRLKCCLRYEDQTYTELKRKLPKKNARVKTAKGLGKVIDGQILTQLVMIEYDNGDKETLPLDEIEILKGFQSKPENRQNAGTNVKQDDSQNEQTDSQNDQEDEQNNRDDKIQ
jgi:cell fate regulator YaaT (PSP1 superfamily)